MPASGSATAANERDQGRLSSRTARSYMGPARRNRLRGQDDDRVGTPPASLALGTAATRGGDHRGQSIARRTAPKIQTDPPTGGRSRDADRGVGIDADPGSVRRDRAPQDGYTTNLTITKVPNETTRASIVLHGTTFPFATLQVGGGAVPVTDFAGIDGTFAVEVPLVPSCANKLTVTAVAQGNKASTTVTVKQRLANPTTTVTGRVLDVVTRVPVSGARVSFGSRYARTSATGGYTLTGIPDGQVACRSRRPAG
jgi:hypothetical protein